MLDSIAPGAPIPSTPLMKRNRLLQDPGWSQFMLISASHIFILESIVDQLAPGASIPSTPLMKRNRLLQDPGWSQFMLISASHIFHFGIHCGPLRTAEGSMLNVRCLHSYVYHVTVTSWN
ncbi:hypothetical protein AVEN_132786-1 [Araneus ventricosus]|uniref:Uncharacterized protein n=1 Tax=Araneus ventricosus TaxID=182803 RepID=A0A4Y2V3N5_ARAVE|nr:hypothetical protein AVEN_132786-1 [Araneus ventricosus]